MRDNIDDPAQDETPRDGGVVLILEDDHLLAKCFARLLATMGVADVAVAHTNAAAVEIVESSRVVAAFVDVSLKFETSEKTARALARREIPFAFVSGREPPEALKQSFPRALVLGKPARKEQIEETLELLKYTVPATVRDGHL